MTYTVHAAKAPGALDPDRDPNVSAAIGGLLARFGVAAADVRDTAADVVVELCAAKGLEVTVAELRWGRMTLQCDPRAARLLSYDRTKLLTELEARCPGEVTELSFRAWSK